MDDKLVDLDWLQNDGLELLSTLEKTDLDEYTQSLESPAEADLNASYFEAFTDLSDYLLGDNSNSGTMEGADALWEVPGNVHVVAPVNTPREILPWTSTSPTPSTSTSSSSSSTTLSSVLEGEKPVKRTADVAFESGEHTPYNPDHNDYIAKRRRVVQTETVAGSADSTTKLSKAEKYIERRKKNNVASKRSRETRKQKFTEMELQAQELEKRNEELRAKVALLEKMAKEMKETLVQKLAHGH